MRATHSFSWSATISGANYSTLLLSYLIPVSCLVKKSIIYRFRQWFSLQSLNMNIIINTSSILKNILKYIKLSQNTFYIVLTQLYFRFSQSYFFEIWPKKLMKLPYVEDTLRILATQKIVATEWEVCKVEFSCVFYLLIRSEANSGIIKFK